MVGTMNHILPVAAMAKHRPEGRPRGESPHNFVRRPAWRFPPPAAFNRMITGAPRSRGIGLRAAAGEEDDRMKRLTKLVLLLAVAALLALTAYAMLGDLTPERQESEQVLTIPLK